MYICSEKDGMAQKQQFRVSRHDLELSKAEVQHKLNTLKAQPVAKVYLKHGRKEFPVKQVLAEVSGGKLIKSSFTTQDAVRVLNALGFEVKEK